MFVDADGTTANVFEENESDRELNKSISKFSAGAGATKKKNKDIMSTNVALLLVN